MITACVAWIRRSPVGTCARLAFPFAQLSTALRRVLAVLLCIRIRLLLFLLTSRALLAFAPRPPLPPSLPLSLLRTVRLLCCDVAAGLAQVIRCMSVRTQGIHNEWRCRTQDGGVRGRTLGATPMTRLVLTAPLLCCLLLLWLDPVPAPLTDPKLNDEFKVKTFGGAISQWTRSDTQDSNAMRGTDWRHWTRHTDTSAPCVFALLLCFVVPSVSLLALSLILLLFFSELSIYLQTETVDHLLVDVSRGEKLRINFDITL